MSATLARRWPDAFEEIRRDFGYDRRADEAAARRLAARLRATPYAPARVVRETAAATSGRAVWVLGAADAAPDDVTRVPTDEPLWVADGAATAAKEAGRSPAVIVTDLDGNLEDQASAARLGAAVFVHAHGDNDAAIRDGLPLFRADRVAGTCQVSPPDPLLNPGGFTDGDRAIHLALHFGAREVILAGFDFERPGRYSGRFDPATKPRKLAWARRLIDELVAAGAPVRFLLGPAPRR